MVGKERLKIGIIYNFNPIWMGGVIYIQNLIKILNYLDNHEMPDVTIFYRSDLQKFVNEIEYPFLHTIEWKFPSTIHGNIQSWVKNKNVFVEDIIKKHDYLNGIFPVQDMSVKSKSKVKLLSWYADLQHKYYPEFFGKRKRIERDLRIKFMLRNTDGLVLSSEAVADDFRKFYKIRKSLKIHIFHFASVIGDYSNLDIKDIQLKYKLPDNYFMVSNQFHKHKNHEVLLKALALLKKKEINVHIAMTGRFREASFSPYMQKLHKLISDNGIESNFSLLGLIPRNEQLLLMKHAQAVIQPSLFEGWSTVIEDAISMQVPVIASSIPVNVEQLGDHGTFFDPNDEVRLAEILSTFPPLNNNDQFYEPYEERVRKAAKTFLNIFKD